MIEKPISRSDVLLALQFCIGQRKGRSMYNVVYSITGVPPSDAEMRHVRKIIEELRVEGHHICAHPVTGYFMAETPVELNTTCKFLYDRAMTSLKQVAAMKRVSLPDLAGQLKLDA